MMIKRKTVYKEPFSKKVRGDEFGNLADYRNGRPHRGQDWAPKEKSIIPAICNGAIKDNFWSDVLGWCIIQSTPDGTFVLYAHLAHKSIWRVGDYIHVKDPIGIVGGGKNTPSGSASTGAHLHLSVGKKQNVHTCAYTELIDPLTLF
jgi:murein DD-endopeptidase MepM/ murein hydrolase activator NlpD